MALARSLLMRSGLIADIGTVSLLVTASGIIGALGLFWATRHTRARFLFERPARLWIAPQVAVSLQPAE